MEILTECRTLNKRYNTNGVPLYDISCTYNGEYITIVGVQCYKLNNNEKYAFLLCDKVYQTKKTKKYKVGYISFEADKIKSSQKRAWLLNHIYATSYSESTGEIELNISDKEKVQHLADMLSNECMYPNNLQRFKNNKVNIIADHIQGLPSYLNIPFTYFDIINLGRLWGYDLSGKKEDNFIENYWNATANLIMQTFKYYKIEV